MTDQATPRTTSISAREAQVLAGVAEHLTNAEIAARLFISVRTVESHVSSLLRKLGVADRRALAGLADRASAGTVVSRPLTPGRRLPVPLTPFVGRATECAALVALLAEHRLVTAVGSGGIGKTRLALAVASQLADQFSDGVSYVDLVPVTHDSMLTSAIAASLAVGEQQGRSADESVLGWLKERDVLLVLDNCEHLLEGVTVLVERLLVACPRVTVLATSRARLLVPYERVFLVPGMTVSGDGGDAVALFLDRIAATGYQTETVDHGRVAGLCRGLDGVALAIELAAARMPALGMDGLEAGLDDRLGLLTGGRRLDDRHRSLRSALTWSYALLTEEERAVIRRTAVFATPFTADAAAAVVSDWPPVEAGQVTAGLAVLADHSLLVAGQGTEGTRYGALETIRQFGAEHLEETGELAAAHTRHLRWCQAMGEALGESLAADQTDGRAEFDRIADELRSALEWAGREPGQRINGHRLAVRLAELCFRRGLPGEAQRRYEQAATLAADDREAASDLHHAALAAQTRHFGDDATRLHSASADASLRAGDRPRAAYDLAQVAELISRGPGLMSESAPRGLVEELIAKASELADGDSAAEARVLIAQAFQGRELNPATAELTDRGIALAQRAGDPLAESAGLDLVTSMQLARGDIRGAAASALRRIELLAPLRRKASACGIEVPDAHQMAAETAIAAGDLAAARTFAEHVRDLPYYLEEGHLATARLLVVTALAGDWDETAALGEVFREGWERAGRPRAGNLSRGPYAAAAVCGLRGDDEGRAEWLTVANGLVTPGRPNSDIHHDEFFDALVLLHNGYAEDATALLAAAPEEFRAWYSGLWRPWYAAVWAEAAVLAGHPAAAERIKRARRCSAANPIAMAIVDRSAALASGDRKGLLTSSERLLTAGCRYQWARALILAGGRERTRGENEMALMGASPMAALPAPG